MRHDDGAHKAGGEPPGGRPDMLLLVVQIQVLDIKCLGKILSQEVGCSSLQSPRVTHHGFNAVGLFGAGKPFSGAFASAE